jgi:hypothetical protein
MEQLLKVLREKGTMEPFSGGMVTFQERDEIVDHPRFQEWERKFLIR